MVKFWHFQPCVVLKTPVLPKKKYVSLLHISHPETLKKAPPTSSFVTRSTYGKQLLGNFKERNELTLSLSSSVNLAWVWIKQSCCFFVCLGFFVYMNTTTIPAEILENTGIIFLYPSVIFSKYFLKDQAFTNARIILHNVFLFHDGHHIGLGHHSAIHFLPCLGQETGNFKSLTLIDHGSRPSLSLRRRVKKWSIMALEGTSRKMS